MKINVLPQDEFDKHYNTVCTPLELDKEAEEELRDRISCLQQALVDQLSCFLEEDEDFEIGWDFDYSYHACGGIYSKKALRERLLKAILEAIAADVEPSAWTVHFVVETDDLESEFFVRDGDVFVPATHDKPNLASQFSRE